jgi:hypothetical protein
VSYDTKAPDLLYTGQGVPEKSASQMQLLDLPPGVLVNNSKTTRNFLENTYMSDVNNFQLLPPLSEKSKQ